MLMKGRCQTDNIFIGHTPGPPRLFRYHTLNLTCICIPITVPGAVPRAVPGIRDSTGMMKGELPVYYDIYVPGLVLSCLEYLRRRRIMKGIISVLRFALLSLAILRFR
jgi:hypothetical protein